MPVTAILALILHFAPGALMQRQEGPRSYSVREEKLPRVVAPQPVPFSHRKHAGAGISCHYCHTTAKIKDWAGLPSIEECMACHGAVTADSPEIRMMAAKWRAGEKIDWIRVYDVPGYVFFSHARHLEGGIDCEACHGPVRIRDVLAQEVSISMPACMNCHELRNVSNGCHFCHTLGH
jgi:hypothetical protein